MNQLPPEITDHIIDHLHDSHPDLRACARVCKVWLQSSRFHLFNSISIHPHKGRKYSSCHRLYEIIQQTPWIALHVRELCFSTGWSSQNRITNFSDWPTLKRVLPLVLRSFTRLRKLKFVATTWAFLTPEIRKPFRDILALPSLVHFETEFLNFFKLEHFKNLLQPHLKQLHVSFKLVGPIFGENGTGGEIDKENEQDAAAGRQPCCLEYLKFDWGPGFIDWLLGPRSFIDVSNLRTLDIHLDNRDIQNLMRLVILSGSSLEHLAIRVYRIEVWVNPVPYRRDCGRSLSLKTLSLSTHISQEDALCVAYLLSNLAVPNLLQISLGFRWDWGSNTDAEWSGWLEVDRILDSQPFPLLHSMKVMLFIPRSCVREMERCCQQFIEYFPLLVSRGIVMELQHDYI